MALHDEKYEIQKAVLTIIGRLSSSIPGIVTNAVRQLILDLLRSLEYSQEPTTIIDSVKLLGLAIHSTSSLIEAYVNPSNTSPTFSRVALSCLSHSQSL